jgi:hypothetical protein
MVAPQLSAFSGQLSAFGVGRALPAIKNPSFTLMQKMLRSSIGRAVPAVFMASRYRRPQAALFF